MQISSIDPTRWQQVSDLTAKRFVCGFCGHTVASRTGYFNTSASNTCMYICPGCGHPSYFIFEEQYPGPLLGREIAHLPSDVSTVYWEMREAVKNSCFTAAVMLGRKLIVHLSVDVAESDENLSFTQHVEALKKTGFIPPTAGEWSAFLKDIGGEKNHEIKVGNKEEGEKIVRLVELLLTIIYEYRDDLSEKSSSNQ